MQFIAISSIPKSVTMNTVWGGNELPWKLVNNEWTIINERNAEGMKRDENQKKMHTG